MKKTVCICGGGSQGHISAGVIGSNPNYQVNVLTRQPALWDHNFTTIDLTGRKYHANINRISDDPIQVVTGSEIVLICLPGYAICEELEKIKSFLSETTTVGCVFGGSGFFLDVLKILGDNCKCFALQRVPFTGRPLEYGHSARLKGYKPYLKVAMMNIKQDEDMIVNMLEDWYKTPVYKLSHYLEATLSNSNPILHPCRLYVLFKDWSPEKIYTRIPYLYDADWDDETSELWVACDNELREIIRRYPINEKEIPSVLEYYGCADIEQLTNKIRSIEPFKGVQPHMIEVKGGYQLDTQHRYFIEDIPYGLVLIKSFAERADVCTPHIDRVLEWAQWVMGKCYIVEGHLVGKDVPNAMQVAHLDIK